MNERRIRLRKTYLYDDVFVLHEQRDGASLDWCHLLKVERANHVDSARRYKCRNSIKRRKYTYIHGVRLGFRLDHFPAKLGA